MSQLFAAFGIDWRLLVINLVNFGLLFAVLSYYLYGPLMHMLEVRQEKLATGVRNADEVAARLSEVDDIRIATLADANKQADTVLADARTAAMLREREIITAGEASAARIVADAKLQAIELQAQAFAESKKEAAKLIVLGIEKLAMEHA